MSSGQRITRWTPRGGCVRSCGYLHRDWERIEASRQGVWIAQAPFVNHASFHVSGIASPLRRLGDMCVTYQNILDSGKPFVTFTNTVLGLPFASDSASAEDLDLQARAEDYPAEVPEGVRGLTMAVDCQNNQSWKRRSMGGTGNPGVGLLGIASFTETPVVDRYGKIWVICSQKVGHARTAENSIS